MQIVEHLPDPFAVLRIGNRLVLKRSYPLKVEKAAALATQMRSDVSFRYAFDHV